MNPTTIRPSKKRLRNLLHRTEERYKQCWAILRMFKPNHNNEFSAKSLFEFQPILCEALLDLDREYRIIEQEKKRVIARKKSTSELWFRSRMKLLKLYQDAILETIKIGKFIGDSFAWFFYSEERGYLFEHLKQPCQRHLPPGLGGIGEREFIKNVKEIGKKFLIYHGTTTFLRIGDVSLIDLKTLKLVALGELKTMEVIPGKLQIRLELIGPVTEKLSIPKSVQPRNVLPPTKLSQPQQERLKRQMVRMQGTIAAEQKKHVNRNISLETPTYASQFADLVKNAQPNKIIYKQFGDGLLLGAYRRSKMNLYSRLESSNSQTLPQEVSEIDSYALRIVKHGSKHNSAYIGSLFYSTNDGPHFIFGTIPLFWWPVDPEIIRSIIFQEILIFSIYNPAHLFDKLEQRGFEIVMKTPHSFSLRKLIGNSAVEFNNFSYFTQLIQHQLLPENVVLSIVEASENELIDNVKKSGSKSIHMDIAFIQKMGLIPTG